MHRISRLSCGCGTLALFCFLTVVRADEKVPIKKLPKSVVDAVKARFPNAKLLEAEKETENGKTVYEIELKNKREDIEATVTAEGKLVEIEIGIAVKDLPKPVTDALESKYPKGKHKEAEKAYKVENGKEILTHYEVELVTAQGEALEVEVSPGGKII